jgi:endonuclease/exonuclease/phosphatase family metal-dependent hydrolase
MLKLAVWNIERSALKSARVREAQLSLIAALGADLILLTETDRSFALPGYGSHFSGPPTDRMYKPHEAAAAVFHRWPDEAETLPVKEAPNLAVCVRFPSSPLGPLIAYCSVIPYQMCDVGKGAMTWQRHQESARRQAADWKELRSRYPDDLLVVGGDFNQVLDGVGRYRNKVSTTLLRDGFASSGLACVTDSPFKGLSRHNVNHIAIDDRIAKSRDIKTSAWEGASEAGRLSDHNGVVVTIGGGST